MVDSSGEFNKLHCHRFFMRRVFGPSSFTHREVGTGGGIGHGAHRAKRMRKNKSLELYERPDRPLGRLDRISDLRPDVDFATESADRPDLSGISDCSLVARPRQFQASKPNTRLCHRPGSGVVKRKRGPSVEPISIHAERRRACEVRNRIGSGGRLFDPAHG